MTKVNFKNSLIALAIGLVMASCGGRGSNAQQSGGNSEAAKTETKSTAQVAGSMEAFTENDRDFVSDEWIKEVAINAGLKNLGKPKGSTVKEAFRSETIYNIRFRCDKPDDLYAAYAKAVWDLNKTVAEKGEFYDGKSKVKSVKSLEDAKSMYSDSYRWYYSFGGDVWELTVRSETSDVIQLVIEK